MMRKIVGLFRRKVFRKNGHGISFVMRLVEGALDAYDISYEVVDYNKIYVYHVGVITVDYSIAWVENEARDIAIKEYYIHLRADNSEATIPIYTTNDVYDSVLMFISDILEKKYGNKIKQELERYGITYTNNMIYKPSGELLVCTMNKRPFIFECVFAIDGDKPNLVFTNIKTELKGQHYERDKIIAFWNTIVWSDDVLGGENVR